jgi:hypothetical protein
MDAKDKDFEDEDPNKDNAGDKDPRDNARDNGGNDAGKDGEHLKGRRKDSSLSWLTWAVISTVLALLVVAGGYLLYKRLTRGMQVKSTTRQQNRAVDELSFAEIQRQNVNNNPSFQQFFGRPKGETCQ